jgi:ribulose-phosphate 3-epimerase
MDGHFVPNLSFGIPVVRAIRRVTSLPLDTHLMIQEPERYVKQFREAGADMITIHIETTPDPRALLNEIRELGAVPGLSLNPPTSVDEMEPFLDFCDLVLVMSVMPGFGGQSFEPVALEKLRQLREIAGERLLLSVDGGVNDQTVRSCVEAGADLLVMGTAFFGHDDYRKRHDELLQMVKATPSQ